MTKRLVAGKMVALLQFLVKNSGETKASIDVEKCLQAYQALKTHFDEEPDGGEVPLSWFGEIIQLACEDYARAKKEKDAVALLDLQDGAVIDRVDHQTAVAFNANCMEILLMHLGTHDKKGVMPDEEALLKCAALTRLVSHATSAELLDIDEAGF